MVPNARQLIDRRFSSTPAYPPIVTLAGATGFNISTDRQLVAAHHLSSQVWKHDNELSEFQGWVVYRIVTKQLNSYQAGHPTDNCCRALQECHRVAETSL